MLTLTNVLARRMLLIVLVLLSACRDSDKNSSLIFDELNESLERSNTAIRNSTQEAYYVLKDKSKKPGMIEKGSYWLGKANLVGVLSSKILDSIDVIERKLANAKSNDELKQYGSLIYKTLSDYGDSILSYDPSINKEFKSQIQLSGSSNFFPLDVRKAQVIINKLRNDLLNVENRVLTYCKNQVGSVDGEGFFRKFQVVAAVNSSKLSVGDS